MFKVLIHILLFKNTIRAIKNMVMNSNIVLVGTGAVGSYFAGRLSQAGARVSALCRSDYDIVRAQGITVQSVAGDFHFMPAEVMKSMDEYGRKPGYIIVSTKVLPEIDIPDLIKSKVYPGTSIVLLQNGINIEEVVAAAFPDNEIISAIAFISVSRPAPGLIDHKDYGRLIIGTYPSGTSDKTGFLADMFKKTGVRCDVDPDIITARWKKLMWNAPFNPMSVLCGGVDTREMMESEQLVSISRDIMNEILLLAEKTGHPVVPSIIDSILSDTRAMAPSKTSMLQDYENRRPLEVDAILGNAVRIARRYGVSAPRLETLYGLLKLADHKNRTV